MGGSSVKTMVYRTALLGLLAGITAGGLSGCGKNSGMAKILNDVKVEVAEIDGELFGTLKANLNTGSMALAGLDLPIVNPKVPSEIYGHVNISNTHCGQPFCSDSLLTVDMNISRILKMAPLMATLPNGTPIPVGGIGGTAVVALPMGDTGARLYIGMGKGVALLGFALPFRQFDGIGKWVPGVNLFQPFTKDTIQGVVGIFTGARAGQNGLALFLDFSSKLNMSNYRAFTVASEMTGLSVRQPVPSRLSFYDVSPSKRQKYNLYSGLNDLNDQRTILNVR